MFAGTELLGDFIVPLILGASFAASAPLVKIMALLFPFAAVNQVITGYILIPFRFDRFVPIVSATMPCDARKGPHAWIEDSGVLNPGTMATAANGGSAPSGTYNV